MRIRSIHAPLRVAFAGLCLLAPFFIHAQPDALVTALLFEPVPLPEEGEAPVRPLISFSAAEADLPEPAAEGTQLSAEDRARIERDIAAYRARVGDSEATEGPYSDQLREDLFNAGRLYQSIADHDNALRMLERTLAVSRINYGLQGLDQVPIMEAMAQSYLAQERVNDADAMMDAAYLLQQEVFGEGSTNLVPGLLKLGDWNTQAFLERSSILVNIPRMNVQNFLQDPRNYIQPVADVKDTPLYKLYQARGNYLTALKTLIDARDFTNRNLLPLERQLLTNYFLYTHQENILYEPDFYLTRKKTATSSRLNQNAIELVNSESYDVGRESHRRILVFVRNDPNAPPSRLAEALLEEADWDLLYERKTTAVDKYEAAYAYFAANPELLEQARAVLYPEVPRVLPTYLPPPNSREKLGIAPDAEVSFFGYIDVQFSLTKFGKARRIRQLGTGGEITRNMEIRLNQYLRNVQFRPRFNGTEADTGMIRLRYFVGI